jgi:hypothetical protein
MNYSELWWIGQMSRLSVRAYCNTPSKLDYFHPYQIMSKVAIGRVNKKLKISY